MSEEIEVKELECISCYSNELVVLGIRDGWIYLECLICGENIKFALDKLDSQSFFATKKNNGQIRLDW